MVGRPAGSIPYDCSEKELSKLGKKKHTRLHAHGFVNTGRVYYRYRPLCLHSTTLHKIHSLLRGLELFLPFRDVNLFSVIQELEVLFREMKLDSRTNELERK